MVKIYFFDTSALVKRYIVASNYMNKISIDS